jgi:hypothetical protein
MEDVMTEEEKAKALWTRIVSSLKKNSQEIKTVRLDNRNGRWFLASVEGDMLSIKDARTYTPSIELTGTRLIGKDEFTIIYPFYEKWRNKKYQRSDICKLSRNTSYIFALIAHFNKSKP